MVNFNILVLHSENALTRDFDLPLGGGKLNIAGYTDNIAEASVIIEKADIRAVLIELATPTTDAYEFIDRINLKERKPLVAVISSLQDESYYTRARRLGAKLVYRAPFNLERVFEDIYRTLCEEIKPLTVNISGDKSLDERLANIFIASGIPPHIKGYQFLREAVKQSVHTPSMINNITKQLYPAVAEKFNTTPSKVERAIRHAIEVAWSRGKIDNINSIYGIKVFGKDDKPTNGELIALVSDKMIIEGM